MPHIGSFSARWDAILERLRPPRRAIPTRAGFFVLASPLPLGLAAVTASNNLLFMLLAAALGTIVISGILSERNLRGVRVRLRAVGAAWAGEPATVRASFDRLGDDRARRHVVRYGLRVRERGPAWNPWRTTVSSQTVARSERMDGVLTVLDDARRDLVLKRRFVSRGRARLGRLELSTRYPFGLLEKSRDLEAEVEVFVRPRRVPLPAVLRLPRARDAAGDLSERRGHGLEFYGLRERKEWDDALRVHALRSLALGRDVVVETAGVERPAAWVAVAGGPETDSEAFERALELAAAALSHWKKGGWDVGLSLPGRALPPGASGLEAMLDALASHEGRAEPTRARGAIWLVPRGALGPSGERTFFVSPNGRLDAGSP